MGKPRMSATERRIHRGLMRSNPGYRRMVAEQKKQNKIWDTFKKEEKIYQEKLKKQKVPYAGPRG